MDWISKYNVINTVDFFFEKLLLDLYDLWKLVTYNSSKKYYYEMEKIIYI